jgi:plastocyanin
MTSSRHLSWSRLIEIAVIALGATTIAIGARAGSNERAPSGAVTGTVRVWNGKKAASSISQVYVYVADATDPSGTRRPRPSIEQHNLQYDPALLVIPVGTTVAFPNGDRGVVHNVFSPKSGDDAFDLGRYKKGKGKKRTFDKPGEIDIYCDIHPTMKAKIKVMPSSRFVAVAADGSFRIDGLPPGEHTIVAWMPDSEEVRTRVVVDDGGEVSANALDLHRGAAASTHRRKDGSSYPDYP